MDYNSKLQFPTNDNFVNRITEVEFTDSKRTGNPMIHVTTEVVAPDSVDIGGKQVNIAGVTVEQYWVTQVSKGQGVDQEKTDNSRNRIKELWEKLGQDPEQINWDNPSLEFLKGKIILTAMGCDVEPMRKSPTPKQIAEAEANGIKPQGDIMEDPIKKRPLVFYKPKIIEIFGFAPNQVAGAATSNKPY